MMPTLLAQLRPHHVREAPDLVEDSMLFYECHH